MIKCIKTWMINDSLYNYGDGFANSIPKQLQEKVEI
jgi:hypothetical protein